MVEFIALPFQSSKNFKFVWSFHVVVVQGQQRNVQKKRDARAELLFCKSLPISFRRLPLPSPLKFLKVPNFLSMMACVAGVRKGRERELGRETAREGGGRRVPFLSPSRAQITPSSFYGRLSA